MELLRLLSTNEVIAQVISFLILLFILRAFAWKKILNLLDARKQKIASDIQSARDARLEIEKLKSEYAAKLSAIDELAREKIKQALEEGKRISEELKSEARKEAEAIASKSRENIRQELLKAREELKEQIVDLALKATESVVLERLTAAHDRKLVEDFLEKIDKA